MSSHAAPHGEPRWAPSLSELEILRLLSRGFTSDAVARRVGLSERTVRRRLRSMGDEAGVGTTIELVVQAVRRELI